DGFSMDKLHNGTAKVRVLPAIETKDLSKRDLNELMQHCHDSMMEVIQELDKPPAQGVASNAGS
ncbi:MAG: hypothetical protein RPR98_09105, partial [Bermanella sp.]